MPYETVVVGVVVIIKFHEVKQQVKQEAFSPAEIPEESQLRASSIAPHGFTGSGPWKRTSFLKLEQDMDFGELGPALHSRFSLLPDSPCSLLHSGYRLDASSLKNLICLP